MWRFCQLSNTSPLMKQVTRAWICRLLEPLPFLDQPEFHFLPDRYKPTHGPMDQSGILGPQILTSTQSQCLEISKRPRCFLLFWTQLLSKWTQASLGEDPKEHLPDMHVAVFTIPSREHGFNHSESDLGLEAALKSCAFPLWWLSSGLWLRPGIFCL